MLRTALRSAARPALRAQPAARPLLLRTVVTTRFTPEHEWVKFDDKTGLGTVGITEYAQKALGDVVFVELPAPQTQVAMGEEIGAVESVKAASDIFAPVSGQITEVNGALEDQPDLLNKSAEADGWLVKIQLSNPGEFDGLLSEDAYKAHTAGESDS
ncbi:glycine cleavage system H-protein subunit [Rhodotorula kratochvilovae]